MFRYLLQLTVIIGLSSQAWSRSVDIGQRFLSDNSSTGLTVVEVKATLKGSGIILLLDGRPVILTNSHNIQGKKVATIRIPSLMVKYLDQVKVSYTDEDIELTEKVSVIIENPLYDFAFLDFPKSLPERLLKPLTIMAKMNGEFCISSMKCKKGWNESKKMLSSYESNIAAVLDGKRFVAKLIRSVQAKKINDTFITGEKIRIYSIPVFARPGVSGGAYYDHGHLKGLLTKISLSGMAETFAMPLDEIGRVLSQSIEPQGKWENGSLILNSGRDEIIVKPRANGGGETGNGGGETGNGGGETGNGGGETGNGGGETSNGGGETGNGGGETGNGGGGPLSNHYWSLVFPRTLGSNEITTWNPFVRRPGEFILNNQNVALLKVGNTFQAPSFATYRNNQINGKKQIPLAGTSSQMAEIEQLRQNDIPGAICGRSSIYNRTNKKFLVNTGIQTTAGDDGVLFVLPDEKGKFPKQFKDYNPIAIIDVPATWIDDEGWNRSSFTAARRSPSLLLDLVVTDFRVPIGRNDGPNGVKIQVEQDLSEITIQDVVLKRLPSHSVTTISFQKGNSKAALLYDPMNLGKLEKAFFLHENLLLEIGRCETFVGVK